MRSQRPFHLDHGIRRRATEACRHDRRPGLGIALAFQCIMQSAVEGPSWAHECVATSAAAIDRNLSLFRIINR